MSKSYTSKPDGDFIAVIGDEDTVTGFLLAGVGNINSKRQSNFLIVTSKTKHSDIEAAFRKFTTSNEIGILLITQNVAEEIRYLLNEYNELIPTILEIPSKDHQYDASKDSVMIKVKRLTGVRD